MALLLLGADFSPQAPSAAAAEAAAAAAAPAVDVETEELMKIVSKYNVSQADIDGTCACAMV